MNNAASTRAVARYAIKEIPSAMTDRCRINLLSYATLQLERVQMASFGRLLEGRDDAMPRGLLEDLVSPA